MNFCSKDEHSEKFDLAAASEVMNYFGNLEDVFAAVATVIRTGAQNLFSLADLIEMKEDDLQLLLRSLPTRRMIIITSFFQMVDFATLS